MQDSISPVVTRLAAAIKEATAVEAVVSERRQRTAALEKTVAEARYRLERQPEVESYMLTLQQRVHQRSVGLYEQLLHRVDSRRAARKRASDFVGVGHRKRIARVAYSTGQRRVRAGHLRRYRGVVDQRRVQRLAVYCVGAFRVAKVHGAGRTRLLDRAASCTSFRRYSFGHGQSDSCPSHFDKPPQR